MNFSDQIMQTFADFLLDDAQLLSDIENYPFVTSAHHWHFTLPSLHHFLQSQAPCFGQLDYKQFRKALFNSPINERLKRLNGEIVIVDNRGNVDVSGYALRRG
ncbi:MAG: hypothetical protein RPR40_03585 [Bermanella sp.]